MKKFLRKINKLSGFGKASLLILIIIMFMVIFAPFISPYSHKIPSGKALEAPSLMHILGTDDLGIDLWSQICYGARISIFIGSFTAVFAGIGGSIIGILSGYYGGILDKVIMRVTDIMIVLPDLPVMIVIGAFFGTSLKNIIVVLSLFLWTIPARVVRSKILSLKEERFIIAARSYGDNFLGITTRHFLPHTMPLIGLNVIKLMSKAIVAEASLAFLGIGDPTSKSWGLILYHAINFNGIYFTPYWKWWVVTPLVAIVSLVLSIAMLLRDIEKIIDVKI